MRRITIDDVQRLLSSTVEDSCILGTYTCALLDDIEERRHFKVKDVLYTHNHITFVIIENGRESQETFKVTIEEVK